MADGLKMKTSTEDKLMFLVGSTIIISATLLFAMVMFTGCNFVSLTVENNMLQSDGATSKITESDHKIDKSKDNIDFSIPIK